MNIKVVMTIMSVFSTTFCTEGNMSDRYNPSTFSVVQVCCQFL